MKKVLSKLLAIILVFSLLFTMPVFSALAEVNNCPIDKISVTLYRPMYQNVDAYVTEGESGEYTHHSIGDYLKYASKINFFYTDGTSKSFTYDEIVENASLSYAVGDYEENQEYNPWQVGTQIDAYFDVYHNASDTWIYCDFTVSFEESPIASLTATATKNLIENINGEVCWDEENNDQFYEYDIGAVEPTFTIKWKDSSKADTTVEYKNVEKLLYCELVFTSDQNAANVWKVGETHTATANLLGAECNFDVTLISSEVVGISAVATHNAILGADNYESYDYINEENYKEFNFDRFFPEIILTFANGAAVTYDYGEFSSKTNSMYDIVVTSNQSSETPWASAGNYSFDIELYSLKDEVSEPLTCKMPVTVAPNPIKSISVKATSPANAVNFDYRDQYDFIVDENEDCYKFYWDTGDPEITVTYTDGTVSEPLSTNELVAAFDDKYYPDTTNIQSYDAPWTFGTNKSSLKFMGHTCEYDIVLTDKFVKSIKVVEAQQNTNPDNGYYDEYGNFIYYTDFEIELELTLWDDSTVTDSVYKNSWCNYGYITVTDTQSEQPWTKGGNNPITVTLIDDFNAESSAIGNVEIVDYFEYDYYYTSDGIIITGYSGTINGVMEIPETIGDSAVYGVSALYSNDAASHLVTGVVIPDGVVQISDYALGYLQNLTSLSIGSGLSVIPENLFIDNPKLETITVSAENPNYYSSQNAIFTKDKTKLVAIAPACTETIILPAECTDIDVLYVYPELYKNAKVGYETAGDYCTVEDGITYNREKTAVLMCDKEKTGSIVLPDSVNSIASNAFLGCDKITSVTIPNSVTNIAYAAFGDCTALKSVTLPTSLKSIDDFAFGNCSSLTSITLPDSLEEIGVSAFTATGLKSITVPDNVESLGKNAFRSSQLETAKLGQGITSMYKAFYKCQNLKSVNVPAGVQNYDLAFYNCISLTSVTLEDGLEIISSNAFSSCDALTSITIPETVTDVEEGAFSYSGLKSITIPDSVIYLGENAFTGCAQLTTATIGDGIEVIEKSVFSGTGIKNINWGSKVEIIGSLSFAYSDLESVEIPNTVTSIMYAAFDNSSDLSSIKIPSSVESVGAHSFDGTAWYKSQPQGVVYNNDILYRQKGDITTPTVINIKNGTRVISDAAFEHLDPENDDPEWFAPDSYYDLSGITEINIPSSVTAIGNMAFAALPGITEITLPDKLSYIGCFPFYNCPNLTTLNIGKATVEFHSVTFANMVGLEEVIADPKNTEYTTLDGVLYDKNMTKLIFCPAAKTGDLVVPESVKSVEAYAFSYTNLDSIAFENPNINIHYYAFSEYGSYYMLSDGYFGMYGYDAYPSREFTLRGAAGSTTENLADNLGIPFEQATKVKEEQTGITVSESTANAIPEGAALVVESVEATEENTVIFDITLEREGEAVQPDAPVMVSIPLPEGIDPALCKVYRLEEDGSKTNMNATVTDSFIYFTTDHFSLYVIESGFVPGDIDGNGIVDLVDVVALSQIAAGWEGVTCVEAALDPNGDQKVDLTDVVLLSQYVAGWQGIELSDEAYSK